MKRNTNDSLANDLLSDLLNLTVKVTTPPCYFDHVTVSLLQAISSIIKQGQDIHSFVYTHSWGSILLDFIYV